MKMQNTRYWNYLEKKKNQIVQNQTSQILPLQPNTYKTKAKQHNGDYQMTQK